MIDKTFCEEADEYIETLKKQIENCSKHEAVCILLEKTRFWYWSAIDWRASYEIAAENKEEKKRR